MSTKNIGKLVAFSVYLILVILTVVIFKSRSTFFGLLRKSLRGKSKLKMRLIFAFFGEFVRFFENSKNQKFQALDRATFGDTPMYENVKAVFKSQNYVFFEPLKTA